MGFFFSSLDGRKEAKEDQGPTGAGEVWPGTERERQTYVFDRFFFHRDRIGEIIF